MAWRVLVQETDLHSQHTSLPLPQLLPIVVEQRHRPDRDWYDVDAANQDDPQACGPYAAAIFTHLRESEVRCGSGCAIITPRGGQHKTAELFFSG